MRFLSFLKKYPFLSFYYSQNSSFLYFPFPRFFSYIDVQTFESFLHIEDGSLFGLRSIFSHKEGLMFLSFYYRASFYLSSEIVLY